jgi:hypothetical protein
MSMQLYSNARRSQAARRATPSFDVRAGQAVVAKPGGWIPYSSPEPDGAEYVAICLPAFSPDTVHRDVE